MSSNSNRESHAFSCPGPTLVTVMIAGLLLLPSCSLKVDDKSESKNVDIQTPLGGLKVRTDVKPEDTGLSVYPGARRKLEKGDNDQHAAHVNISSSLFGVKVVAIEFQSDDSPEKVIAYYKNDLQKYGNVLECHTSKHGGNVNANAGGDKKSKELTCEETGGKTVELKTGTSENQHIVAIDPKDKGADFALVYVMTRGERNPI